MCRRYKTQSGVTRISYDLRIFLILVRCRIATRIEIVYQACDEEILKSLLILTLLTIISRYQWHYKFDKN